MDNKIVTLRDIAQEGSLAFKQSMLIEALQQKIKDLESKNNHLETMFKSNTPNLLLDLSTEEKICVQQISLLDHISMSRPLTLDECKRLDLLVKNLQLARKESTITVKVERDLSDQDLLSIVQSDDQEED